MTFDLSTLNTPGPTITQTTAPFWEAIENGQLMLQYCKNCNENIFYPRSICPKCWSHKIIWKKATGYGKLKSYSVVHKPGHPAWVPATPYIVGLVKLDEGATMLSLITVADGHRCRVGDKLMFEPTKVSGRILPTFKPIED